MQIILNRRSHIVQISAAVFPLAAFATAAQADIFQWEYINPADPSQGKQQSTTLAPDGAGVDAVPGAYLFRRNLTMAYLIGADLASASARGAILANADLSQANLTHAYFGGATLTDADFTNAEVRGANFASAARCGNDPGSGCSGTGISLAQLYSTASFQAHDLSAIGLQSNNLAGGTFADQNLTNALFAGATLTNADFTGAEVQGAWFVSWTPDDFSAAQLYSTASYQAHDLTGIVLSGDLRGWNFAGQNLTNAWFDGATLTNADFTAADARGATFYSFDLGDAITTNLIRTDGHIDGLDLYAGGLLLVRDYNGNPLHAQPTPIPITVDQHLAMGPGGTLRMVFEADDWDSTISFAPGIPVTLGGTLELTFADDVNLAIQVGRTFDLFDWTGVHPTGAFAIASPYAWDLSNLYTTGEVTLTAVPEPRSFALVVAGALVPIFYRRTLLSG